MRRFFLEREKILSDSPILTGSNVKHLRTVLRIKPGDEILLFDGKGSEYRARIIASTSKTIVLSILERFPSIAESPVRITIGQGLLKARQMDRIVRQVTELGVYTLIPVLADRSVPGHRPERWTEKEKRWETIAWESLKQCGRSQIPRLGPPISFKAAVSMAETDDLKIIFHEDRSKSGPTPRLQDARDVQRVWALIGPEGGFTQDEVEMALAGGFVSLSLGPRILKADTAVIAACTILQNAFGDVGPPQEKS